VLAREPALEGGLIDGWPILDCPARRSGIVIGRSIGRTRQAKASETPKACGRRDARSTRLQGFPNVEERQIG